MNYDQYLIELLEILQVTKDDLVSRLKKSDQALSVNWFNGTSKPNKNSRAKISSILFNKKTEDAKSFMHQCANNEELEVLGDYLSRLYDVCHMVTENEDLEELIIKQKIQIEDLNKIISTRSSAG